ncbi:TPA: hypothetical protein IUY54_002269 [Enterococcus faecalis]|uniref:Qat anti-phage system QueC-like protein QatC n=1 Tax=Enterococcus TaxID=1350 RepID=UPI0001CB2A00|nr:MULTISPECIES: Qat anti-phage system QueC-like protein QatC [Enterococcus]HAP3747432.1 hypothetical protein [Enterococcus faecalis TDR28]HAP3753280.1 hypothetical protein [Enterococcus faecalis TDR22]HAP3756263.1 hypothetical protein [Enterococcus faecalis TDR13]HAP3759287.1 hypothetical protein [Enterococcus faecalis TDR7]HAP3770441.1 hypothetical protein [Enterococcus faecalis TDR19]
MSDNKATISSGKLNFNIDMELSTSYRDTFLEQVFSNSCYVVDEIRLDLLYISNFVYAADRRISRSNALDAWTREIQLTIPVICLSHWNRVRNLLNELLNFLTGDIWEINFTDRKKNERESKLFEFVENQPEYFYSQVCMFSGGLDSFIGSIDILRGQTTSNTLFVSHYGGGSKGTKGYQDLLVKEMINHFSSLSLSNFFSFYSAAMKTPTGQDEPTTRSRSFMFFAHAIALTPDNAKLIIPENGFVSLNIPLYFSRNGSSSTRTTHPFYMNLFQKILNILGINVRLENPYQFLTKGQMMNNCLDKEFLSRNIINTMSCSHPEQARWSGCSDPIHCGYCIPCTIRRASINEFCSPDPTLYRYLNYQNKIGKETHNALRIALQKYEKSNHFMVVQRSGSLISDIKKYVSVYEEGMEEIRRLLYEGE